VRVDDRHHCVKPASGQRHTKCYTLPRALAHAFGSMPVTTLRGQPTHFNQRSRLRSLSSGHIMLDAEQFTASKWCFP
jgi:hypothetical protein